MWKEMQVGDRLYKAVPFTVTGDYGGDGAVGEANQQVLVSRYEAEEVMYGDEPKGGKPLIVVIADYGSAQVLMDTGHQDYEEVLRELREDPVLDDDVLFRIEDEWACRAAEDDLIIDLKLLLEFDHPEAWRTLNRLYTHDRQAYLGVIWTAAGLTFTEPVMEFSGAYWDADRLVGGVLEQLEQEA